LIYRFDTNKDLAMCQRHYPSTLPVRAACLVIAAVLALLATRSASVAAEPEKAATKTRWESTLEKMPVMNATATTPAASQPAGAPFTVPPGFEVERLFVLPKDELGSWVCITTDAKGRLIASDQGDKGLVRVTPAPLHPGKCQSPPGCWVLG
jgi:hypothetical protein